MSYDLWVWKGPAYTLKTINSGIYRIENGDEEAFEPDPRLRRFRNDVLDALPLLDGGDTSASKTWAATPNISDRLIELNLSFGIRDDALDEILHLVEEHDLWLYDPQRALVQPPASGRQDAEHGWRRLLRLRR